MKEYLQRTWAEVDLGMLEQNCRAVSSFAGPGCRVMAIVKADGYGHGAVASARVFAGAGVSWFGVSNMDEAMQLRDSGIEGHILILGYTPPDQAGKLSACDITQTVFDSEYAGSLSGEAVRAGVKIRVHIKTDTGMGRIGFPCLSEAEMPMAADGIEGVCRLPGLVPEGIYTHFASADEKNDGGYTKAQFDMFCGLTGELDRRGIRFPLRHCCNSAATLHYPEMHLDMVRPGLVLYGLYPDGWMRDVLALSPAMELKSVVSMVKQVPAGVCVSYGRTFRTEKPSTLATIPLGYADGYPRCLSDRAGVLVVGQLAPLAGRVCMDQCVLDVTGIDGVYEGLTVTVFGRDGDALLSVDRLAELAGTINYELVCGIGKRVPRVYSRP